MKRFILGTITALLFFGIFVEQTFAQVTGTHGGITGGGTNGTTGGHSGVNTSGNTTNGKSASASASGNDVPVDNIADLDHQ